MPTRHTPRLGHFAYRGSYRYFWTICTHMRRRIFVDAAIVSPVCDCFQRASRTEDVAVIAYCFMPDHVHLLLAGRSERSGAERFVSRAKQASGYWFSCEYGGRLWQRSSWDRVLRLEEDTPTALRYLLANPVRAGLVDRPLEYPFSGSFEYERAALEEVFHVAPGL